MRSLGIVLVGACASCGGVIVDQPGSGGAGGSGGALTTASTSSSSDVSSTAAFLDASSSGVGGASGFGDCANEPPCGASASEAITFAGGSLPPNPTPAIVRAWVFHGKGGGGQLQMRACFTVAGKDLVFTPTFSLSSAPPALGASTDASAYYDPKYGQPLSGATPGQPITVDVMKLDDVDGLVEGTFDALLTNGTDTQALKGSFVACREPDEYAP